MKTQMSGLPHTDGIIFQENVVILSRIVGAKGLLLEVKGKATMVAEILENKKDFVVVVFGFVPNKK